MLTVPYRQLSLVFTIDPYPVYLLGRSACAEKGPFGEPELKLSVSVRIVATLLVKATL